MKTFKQIFRSVPPLKWLDDFTDTTPGQSVVFALGVLAGILWLAYILSL